MTCRLRTNQLLRAIPLSAKILRSYSLAICRLNSAKDQRRPTNNGSPTCTANGSAVIYQRVKFSLPRVRFPAPGSLDARRFFKLAERCFDDSSHDRQTFRAAMFNSVLSRVPVAVIGAVIEVDQVHSGHASIYKRDVVIGDGRFVLQEIL